jgi:protein arginine kinase activator
MSSSTRECGNCHLKFSEFEATGLLGCPACYGEFQEEIDRILELRYGAAVHTGKRYAVKVDDRTGNTDVKKLTEELSDAVRREAFELAARLRDRIRKDSAAQSHPQ